MIKGTPLTAFTNNKLWYNNEEFTYDHKEGDKVYIKRCDNEFVFYVDSELFIKNFNVNYAMTVDRAQSTTFNFKFVVFENERLNRNRLYTAVTRGTTWDNIYIDKPIKKIIPIEYKTNKEYVVKNNVYKTGIIYKISHIDKTKKKFYIGCTMDTLENRWAMHKKCPSGGVKQAIDKYGIDAFKIEILEKVPYKIKKELFTREQIHIKNTPQNLLYNIQVKGKSSKNSILKKMFGNIVVKGISCDEKNKRYRVKGKTFRWSNIDRKELAYRRALNFLYDFIEV